MPPISVMIKPASGLCNMMCDYCFYSDEAKKRTCETYGYMTEQTLKNVIRKTIRSAEYYVNYAFQGGEPTLRGIEFLRKLLSFRKSLISTELQLIIQFRQMAIILMRTGANF